MSGRSQQSSLTSFFAPKTSQAPTPLDSESCNNMSSTSSTKTAGAAGTAGSSSKRAMADSSSSSAANTGKSASKRSKVDDGAASTSSGDNTVPSPIKEDGWATALASETSRSYFQWLRAFLDTEYASKTREIYPPKRQLFNAFESCPLGDVKVVILGQDPYHQPGQAHGLAFSVAEGVTQPPSLRNMVKEAVSCVGIRPTKSGNLDGWCKQGVLLLNSVLSVERSKAFSHRKQGWETFTDAVVRILNSGDRRLVFMLWGKPSQKKGAIIDKSKHRVLECAHPSPLSATRGPEPFIGSRCFKHANDALVKLGHDAIDWNIE